MGEYVALRNAGGGNLKGLCPFHDEKTPSFQVSPSRGYYHCFGCGEGGDVFKFLQELEHLTYVESVQRLAERANITLTIVEGGSSTQAERGTRSRLQAANKAAAEFYEEQLTTDGAATAREFLAQRGFDLAAAAHFGCGYAPDGWDRLVKALTARGFSLDELYRAGLARQGQRGPIDQFHRRLLWAIRDSSDDVVGFGARRLFDDDRLEAKYVNTAETPLYKKSQVLFGLDLAKRDIIRQRRAVVVEGYTDVMAMHLAGVTTAVASCGTAFGDEHISVLRRYLRDTQTAFGTSLPQGEVVYTFDGDSAGQKAALKAFDSDQRFAANTYVAVAPSGMDPCELRQAKGDEAVRALVENRSPLFAFAITTTLDGYNLDTAEGRVAATNATIPLVAGIKEKTLRDEYILQLSGWLGTEVEPIARRVREFDEAAARAAKREAAKQAADERGTTRNVDASGRGAGHRPDQRPAGPGRPAGRDDRRDNRNGSAGPASGSGDRTGSAGPASSSGDRNRPAGPANGGGDPRGNDREDQRRPAPPTGSATTRNGQFRRSDQQAGWQDPYAGHEPPAEPPEDEPEPPEDLNSPAVVHRRPDPRDQSLTVEREALQLALQHPDLVVDGYPQVRAEAFTNPTYAAIHEAIAAAGGPPGDMAKAAWVESVTEYTPAGVLRSLVSELAVVPPAVPPDALNAQYAGAILARMAERVAKADVDNLVSALRRAEAAGDVERARELHADLLAVANYRRALADRARGDS